MYHKLVLPGVTKLKVSPDFTIVGITDVASSPNIDIRYRRGNGLIEVEFESVISGDEAPSNAVGDIIGSCVSDGTSFDVYQLGDTAAPVEPVVDPVVEPVVEPVPIVGQTHDVVITDEIHDEEEDEEVVTEMTSENDSDNETDSESSTDTKSSYGSYEPDLNTENE